MTKGFIAAAYDGTATSSRVAAVGRTSRGSTDNGHDRTFEIARDCIAIIRNNICDSADC